jgi:hypothetical protein
MARVGCWGGGVKRKRGGRGDGHVNGPIVAAALVRGGGGVPEDFREVRQRAAVVEVAEG